MENQEGASLKWLIDIEAEWNRLVPEQHPGRTRTIARRAAGIALMELYKSSGDDFVRLLRQASDDSNLPDDVRSSSARLASRLSADFTSASTDPIGDAKTIVEFVKKQLL